MFPAGSAQPYRRDPPARPGARRARPAACPAHVSRPRYRWVCRPEASCPAGHRSTAASTSSSCYATAVVPTGPTAPAARCCPPSTPPTRAPAPPTDAPDHQAGQPDPAHAPPAPRATTPPDQAPGNITSYLLRKQRTIQSGASTTNPRTPGLNVYAAGWGLRLEWGPGYGQELHPKGK